MYCVRKAVRHSQYSHLSMKYECTGIRWFHNILNLRNLHSLKSLKCCDSGGVYKDVTRNQLSEKSRNKLQLNIFYKPQIKDVLALPLCTGRILDSRIVTAAATHIRCFHISTINHLRNEKLDKLNTLDNFTKTSIEHSEALEKTTISNRIDLSDILDDEIVATDKKLHQQPKNKLNSFYNMVSQETQTDYKIVPTYSTNQHQWVCTYHLKWPEPIKISKRATTKKEASHKAAIVALEWLKQQKKISSEGKPIIYDASTVKDLIHKKSRKVLNLDECVVNNLDSIYKKYNENLINLLHSDVDNLQQEENPSFTDLENPWPVNQTRQRALSPQQYFTKEEVLLPIQKFREDIIDLVHKNRIVIIKGETGCGKSIRVPQYVLESWFRNEDTAGKPCKIIVTQPRRIAAISLAERVAFEREEEVGKVVGYQVRFKTNFSSIWGRILYCTTGILLRRLQTDPTLKDCSHIILDEAHERDVNIDLLMNLLQYALQLNPEIKLILMSATINTEVLQEYFKGASVFHVPGFVHPVTQYFIDSYRDVNYDKTLKMCETNLPQVVAEDVVDTILHIHENKPEGAILCFLPGWEDISRVGRLLAATNNMTVLNLHSKLDIADQQKIFARLPPGVRKVILSTNIAETSVTIDDVVYVIDTGIEKQTRFDVEKGIMCMDQCWISQANVTQRKGRAGRVQPGESYHLYPKKKMETFTQYPTPEMLRTSLVKIVLDSKVYSNNMNAIEFLGQLPAPPSEIAITGAVNELIELDLLDEHENLTPLGKTLSSFQMEPKLAKAIANAVIFQCITPIVDIVTLFSEENNIFSKALQSYDYVKDIKSKFSATSDHLALMKILEKWLACIEDGYRYMADEFCARNNLIDYKLYTFRKIREVYFDYAYKGFNSEVTISDDFSNNDELIKAVLLSGAGSILTLNNIEKVKGQLKKKDVFLTRNNHKANISLDSVNSKKKKFPSDFIVYLNETRSIIRRITTVRETSFISLLSILLFKNEDLILKEIPNSEYCTELTSNDQVSLALKNAKIHCIVDRSQAMSIVRCKEALNSGIMYYTAQITSKNPRNPQIDAEWKEILNILSSLLLSFKT